MAIVGKEALSERDVKFLEFADLFEDKFVRQGKDEDRTIENTLDLGANHGSREAMPAGMAGPGSSSATSRPRS